MRLLTRFRNLQQHANRSLAGLTGEAFVFLGQMMDFEKFHGLVPAVVQDDATNEVLMVGFMNEEALRQTRQSGFVTFFSRTRSALWMKGETSGNRLKVVQMLTDCDDDTVLVRVQRQGDGHVCHLGTVSCFTREIV